MSKPQSLTIAIDEAQHVSGLLQAPANARACYAFAHGAGAGMEHRFMAAIADGLAARGIATLRYQFPYMERGSKRPDMPPVAQATVRAAVAKAAQLPAGVPLFAGGKSFGGRMTSQAQASVPLPFVRGLIFFGFPLHPAGKASAARAAHLSEIELPMLFVQGTRDALASIDLVRPLIERLRPRATLRLLEEADHSLHVAARSGRTDVEVMDAALDATALWIRANT